VDFVRLTEILETSPLVSCSPKSRINENGGKRKNSHFSLPMRAHADPELTYFAEKEAQKLTSL